LSDAVVKSENSKVLSQKQISVLKSQIFGTNEDGSPKTQLNAKEVLKRLKTRLGTNDPILDRVIELMDDETMCYMSDFTAIRKSGSYNGDDNIIELYFGLFDANHNNNRTMIHEAIHAITSRFIDNNPDHQLVKELSDLISVAKDKIKNTDDTEIAYYLSKPKEFIAGFFSDERFRDLLMQVEYSKSKSIFDRIVE
jgi:hypothetical protein